MKISSATTKTQHSQRKKERKKDIYYISDGSDCKESACNAGDPSPGEFHGQKSMVGYSPWGHKRVGHD